MGVEWSDAWKLLPIALPFMLGVLKSWRNEWKGPRSLARFAHREVALALMTQDRDYYKATCDELIEWINQRAEYAESLDALDVISPRVSPMQDLHPRDPQTIPVIQKRLRKPKPISKGPPS